MTLAPLLLRGDCLEKLAVIPDESVDAVVTDPPYGLANTDPAHVVEALTRWAQGERDFIPSGRGFMGKSWDAFVPPPAVWDECARILKPGGHLLAFAGSRTFDLMTLSIRFAGFDIRDSIAWLYGSGFPKSMDVSKAIDATIVHGGSHSTHIRKANASRPGDGRPAGPLPVNGIVADKMSEGHMTNGNAQTPEGEEWQGWGTALKPAFEPIVVARKPFAGTVAKNVLEHGTGALNIDATRIAGDNPSIARRKGSTAHLDGQREGAAAEHNAAGRVVSRTSPERFTETRAGESLGRWPANVVLDEPQAAALDAQAPKTGAAAKASGASKTGRSERGSMSGHFNGTDDEPAFYGDTGGASRFFYVAKAPKSERPVVDGTAHPTVKPLALMRWLLRLVTPEGGCVVDPFAGSGTTLEAAYLEGFEAIGVEMTPDYWPLIEARIERVTR